MKQIIRLFDESELLITDSFNVENKEVTMKNTVYLFELWYCYTGEYFQVYVRYDDEYDTVSCNYNDKFETVEEANLSITKYIKVITSKEEYEYIYSTIDNEF